MKIYLYESHKGGYFTSYFKLKRNELYCAKCNDYDWLLGSFENTKQVEEFINTQEKEFRFGEEK